MRNGFLSGFNKKIESRHDKTNKMICASSEDSDQSVLSAWSKILSQTTHLAHSEDSVQTWRMLLSRI